MRPLALSLCLFLSTISRAEDKPILVLNPEGHTAIVKKVLFTPNGKELITISDDKTIRFWDVATGESLRVLRPPIGIGPEGSLFSGAISPNGELLAVGGYGWTGKNNPIYLISLKHRRMVRLINGHTNVINSLDFSTDGKMLVSGSQDHTACVWDVATGRRISVLRGHKDQICGVAFSPDGRHVATASHDGLGAIWDVRTGRSLAALRGHTDRVQCVDWSPDGRTIVTSGYDRSVLLWNTNGNFRFAFPKMNSTVSSVTFSPSSEEILVTKGIQRDTSCSILNLATGRERLSFRRHINSVFSGAFTPDGTLAATTGGHNADTFIWNPRTGKVIHHLVGKGRTPYSCGWNRNGVTIAWGNLNRNAGVNALSPLEHSFHLTELDFGDRPNGGFRRARQTLGTRSLVPQGRGTLVVTNGGQRQTSLRLAYKTDEVRCFDLLPENRAIVGADFGISLFDTRFGRLIRNYVAHSGSVWAIAPSPDNRHFMSGSNDQTLRIWDVDHREPLLSLFFAGREWIAWTNEGYYACSAGGEKLMGWHVNQGKDKLAKFYPASQFRKKLFRPDVIKLILRTGNLERALAIADKKRGEKTRVGEIGDLLPPTVKITSPRDGQVEGGKLTVTARAKSRGRHPIVAFKLLVDGQQLPGRRGIFYVTNPKLGDATASWRIELKPGRHRLQVLAESKVSQGASDSVTLVYKGEKPRLRKPRLILLSIGISNYQHKSVGRLNYAATDAKKIVDTILKHSKPLFREIETKLLMDKEATKGNILDGLDWMIEEATEDDYVVLYFSGHGELDNRGNLYFLPVEADKDRLRRTALPSDELLKALRDLPKSRRILMLDACHAGAVGTGKRKRAGNSLTDDLARDLLLPGYGTVVMCSSSGKEFSQENNAHRMGNFTLAITEGLAGKGGKDKAGTVMTHHLHAYVVDRVKELTKGQQHPLMKNPDGIRSFPLSRPK